MTLLVSILERDRVHLLSDRRLTRPDGGVFDDESNKAIVVTFPSGTFLMGITGLAQISGQPTVAWLAEKLFDNVQPDYGVPRTLDRLRAQLEAAFASLPHARANRRLTVLGIGFVLQREDQPIPARWRISNFERASMPPLAEAEPTFALEAWNRADGSQLTPGVWVDGATLIGKKAEQSVRELRALLSRHKPDAALIGKGVELIREAASSTIGSARRSWRYRLVLTIPTLMQRSGISQGSRLRITLDRRW